MTTKNLSPAAIEEMRALGLTNQDDSPNTEKRAGLLPLPNREHIKKSSIRAPEVLNEATEYHPRPSSFSRGMRVELGDAVLLFLSGTASVDEHGNSLYPGDFTAQCLRTFRNLTALLAAEKASWHDVVRTSCYLRDIERDYHDFNAIRTHFMSSLNLDPVPASTGSQARLCRPELLVEIEAIAVIPKVHNNRNP